jgi:Amt family ammonium transporter
MTNKTWLRAGLPALFATTIAAIPALAQDGPTIDKADTTWMMVATVLVLVMTVPGLALFYGGLVRSKNMLSTLMQVFYAVAVTILIWVIYGYSLTFTGGSDFIGGFSKAFLSGIAPDSPGATFSVGVAIPELVFVMFQATFAGITAALLLGSLVERTKFAAIALFIPLWLTFVYFPVAHMVWYWAGPDTIDAAAKALALARRPHRRSSTKRSPTPVISSKPVRSTLPAARSCISIPGSPDSWARCWSASVSATARS